MFLLTKNIIPGGARKYLVSVVPGIQGGRGWAGSGLDVRGDWWPPHRCERERSPHQIPQNGVPLSVIGMTPDREGDRNLEFVDASFDGSGIALAFFSPPLSFTSPSRIGRH